MKSKQLIYDVTPSKGFMQEAVASLNYSLIGLNIRKKRVNIEYIPSSDVIQVITELDYSEGDYMPSGDDWR